MYYFEYTCVECNKEWIAQSNNAYYAFAQDNNKVSLAFTFCNDDCREMWYNKWSKLAKEMGYKYEVFDKEI